MVNNNKETNKNKRNAQRSIIFLDVAVSGRPMRHKEARGVKKAATTIQNERMSCKALAFSLEMTPRALHKLFHNIHNSVYFDAQQTETRIERK